METRSANRKDEGGKAYQNFLTKCVTGHLHEQNINNKQTHKVRCSKECIDYYYCLRTEELHTWTSPWRRSWSLTKAIASELQKTFRYVKTLKLDICELNFILELAEKNFKAEQLYL